MSGVTPAKSKIAKQGDRGGASPAAAAAAAQSAKPEAEYNCSTRLAKLKQKTAFPIDQQVIVIGLKSTLGKLFNTQVGTVVGPNTVEDGMERYPIKFSSGDCYYIKPENLRRKTVIILKGDRVKVMGLTDPGSQKLNGKTGVVEGSKNDQYIIRFDDGIEKGITKTNLSIVAQGISLNDYNFQVFMNGYPTVPVSSTRCIGSYSNKKCLGDPMKTTLFYLTRSNFNDNPDLCSCVSDCRLHPVLKHLSTKEIIKLNKLIDFIAFDYLRKEPRFFDYLGMPTTTDIQKFMFQKLKNVLDEAETCLAKTGEKTDFFTFLKDSSKNVNDLAKTLR